MADYFGYRSYNNFLSEINNHQHCILWKMNLLIIIKKKKEKKKKRKKKKTPVNHLMRILLQGKEHLANVGFTIWLVGFYSM